MADATVCVTMITDINSEDRLVQKRFAEYLHDALGWESVYAYNG